MPCRSDYMEPTPRELEETRKLRERTQALADRAVYASDMLREYLLDNLSEKEILEYVGHSYEMSQQLDDIATKNRGLYVKMPEGHWKQAYDEVSRYCVLDNFATRMEPPTKKQMQTIERQQIEHRKKDLARLLKVLGEAGDVERLRKVIDADPSKMLEPQLGFSPDDF